MLVFLTIIAFFLLFFLSRKLTTTIFQLFYLVTRSKRVSMHLLAILFLPGTAIHEFSHLVVATILQVPTGKLTLAPEFDHEGGVHAGSIQLAKSDPFRGTLIGLAPVIVGLSILGALGHFLHLETLAFISQTNHLLLAAYLLILFELGNTMFTSRSDLQDAVILVLFLSSFGLLLHALGVQFVLFFPQQFVESAQVVAKSVSIGLIGVAGIDIAVLIVIRILLFVLEQLTN